jgi:hypothetical protein
MFWTPLCPSSGASHYCTYSLWLPCDVVLVASSSPVVAAVKTGLEDATNITSQGNQRLYVQ